MAHAAPLQAAERSSPRVPQDDPLEAMLALCSQARPQPGGAEARELRRLLAAAAATGGADASDRIAQVMAHEDWWAVGTPAEADPEAEAAGGDERRLVAKLAACGRLRPGLLLSALGEGRLARFHANLATLSGCDEAALERAVSHPPMLALALAVRAAGVDRAAFPAILAGLGGLGGALCTETADAQAIAAALALSPADAGARLAAALHA